MGDRRTVHITNGQTDAWMTPGEYEAYVSSIEPSARSNIQVLSGPIESITETPTEGLRRGGLTHEQLLEEQLTGTSKVVTGPEDVQAWTSGEQTEIQHQIAGQFLGQALTGIEHATLGVASIAENIAFGADVASAQRAERERANRGTGLAIDLALLAAGGVGMEAALAKGAVGGVAGKVLQSMPGRIAAAGLMGDAYLHAQHLITYNKPFVAEDFAKDMLVGAAFTLPFVGMAASRGLVGAAARHAGQSLIGEGGASVLRAGREAAVLGAITSPLGSIQAKMMARGAAALGFVDRMRGRVHGAVKGRAAAKAAGVADEAARRAAAEADEASFIGNFTHEKLGKLSVAERIRVTTQMAQKYGIDLGDINFRSIKDDVDGVRKGMDRVSGQAAKMPNNVSRPAKWAGDLNDAQKANWMVNADQIFSKLYSNGWGDIASRLEKHALSKTPGDTFGDYIQARVEAAIKRNVPGSAQADELLHNFIEDKTVWGGQRAAQGAEINKGINLLRDAHARLDQLKVPKKLDDIRAGQPTASLDATKRAIADIRQAHGLLEKHGVLKGAKRIELDNDLTALEKSIEKGGKSYEDIGRVNTARDAAERTRQARQAEAVQGSQTPEDTLGSKAEKVVETAKRVGAIKNYAIDVLNGKMTIVETIAKLQGEFGVRGVYVLREMDRKNKEDLYLHLQETLPQLMSSPELLEDYIGQQIDPFDSTDPEHSFLTAGAATRAIFYLGRSLPAPDRSLYGKNLPPPRAKVEAFTEKVAAVLDPPSVYMAALEGRATENMMDALRNTHPAFLADIGVDLSEVIQTVDPIKAPRKALNGISTLLGYIDPIRQGETLMLLQSDYAQNEQQQEQIFGPGGFQPLQKSFKDKSDPQESGNPFTFTQRLMSY